MFCQEILVTVSVLGVSPEIDFETKQATGNIKIDAGFRNSSGKHITRTIKIANSTVSEYSTYLDEKVNLRLERECVCFWEKMKNHQENDNQDRNVWTFFLFQS